MKEGLCRRHGYGKRRNGETGNRRKGEAESRKKLKA